MNVWFGLDCRGILKFGEYETGQTRAARFHNLTEKLKEWQPDIIAIEDVYVLKSYPRAAIQLGEVKGIIGLAAAQAAKEYFQIKPTEIKHGLTGNGRATKEQVCRALQKNLGLKHPITPEHASDAAAIALMALSRTGRYTW